jgi:hypothetical protein
MNAIAFTERCALLRASKDDGVRNTTHNKKTREARAFFAGLTA